MTIIGQYEIHEEIGRGGFAAVRRAVHRALGVEAAVKVLHPLYLHDARARERFVREAQLASALEHPHIVRILDLYDEPERVAIAMEYFPRGDLRRWRAENPDAGWREKLTLLRDVAEALDYAHTRPAPVLHRDVKPANILLDAAGRAHLGDFGLARVADDPGLTQIGQVVGTPTYLSPEQAEGRPLDGRADQYALAIVAYELLAGQPPFTGDSSTAISVMHITRTPPAPSSLNAALPAEVDAVLLRALAKDPAARYPACADLARALAAAFDDSLRRAFRETLAAARAALAAGDLPAAARALQQAAAALPGHPEFQAPLAEVERERQQAELYAQLARDWEAARRKALGVLEVAPAHPDPEGVFAAFALRRPPRPDLTAGPLARALAAGLALGLAAAAGVAYLTFRWIVR